MPICLKCKNQFKKTGKNDKICSACWFKDKKDKGFGKPYNEIECSHCHEKILAQENRIAMIHYKILKGLTYFGGGRKRKHKTLATFHIRCFEKWDKKKLLIS